MDNERLNHMQDVTTAVELARIGERLGGLKETVDGLQSVVRGKNGHDGLENRLTSIEGKVDDLVGRTSTTSSKTWDVVKIALTSAFSVGMLQGIVSYLGR